MGLGDREGGIISEEKKEMINMAFSLFSTLYGEVHSKNSSHCTSLSAQKILDFRLPV